MDSKERDLELLTSIYQNCQTAIQSIENIEPEVENKELRAELREELANYRDFAIKCKRLSPEKLADNNMFEKARLWTSIKMTTLTDKSTRHLAEMLLLGTVMGTLQCYKDLSDYRAASKEILELCGELQVLEEKHFNYLKMFLQKDL